MFLILFVFMSIKSCCGEELLYPFGTSEGDTPAPAHGASPPILLNHNITFYKTQFDRVYVCGSGSILFDDVSGERWRPWCPKPSMKFPGRGGHPIIAPFLVQQYTNDNPYQHSTSWYYDSLYASQNWPPLEDRRYIEKSDRHWYRVTSDRHLIKRAQKEIRKYFPECNKRFRPKELLIVTWNGTEDIDYCEERDWTIEQCSCFFENNPLETADYPYTLQYMKEYCDCVYIDGKDEGLCQCMIGNDNQEECLSRKRDVPYQESPRRKRLVDTHEKNTYQAVVMTDGDQTYVMFNYERIEWVLTRAVFDPIDKWMLDYEYAYQYWATVGFNKGDAANAYVHRFSGSDKLYKLASKSNVKLPGRWVYQVNRRKPVGPDCEFLN